VRKTMDLEHEYSINAAVTGKSMTVRQLMSKLQKAPPDMKVVVFADGEVYPAIQTQIFQEDTDSEREFEISCGWIPRKHF